MSAVEVFLNDIIGSLVSGIRRVYYEYRGALDKTTGAIEFRFADGTYLLLDSGADGELLTAVRSCWTDPFGEDQMTPANREFVAKSGKWTAVDVMEDSNFRDLVGVVIEGTELIEKPGHRIVGVILRTRGGDVTIKVEADDVYVEFH